MLGVGYNRFVLLLRNGEGVLFYKLMNKEDFIRGL